MKTVIRPETEMKDSGIEWIGDIPKDWNSAPIKVNFDIYAGATPSSNNPIYWDGDIAWITPADYKTEDKYVSCGKRHISQDGYDNCSAILVPANSIIFSKRAPIGTVAISKNELCTNQGCLSCVSKDDSNIEFYYYAMSIATEEFELKGSGTTFKEISLANFKNFRFAVPPLSEQQAIADYLDETCSKIDEIIAEAKASIDEYKELKQAVIFEAVTKGLDKNVEMKDSGVEWMGVIPKHWSTPKLKYFTNISSGGTPDRNHYEYWNGNVNWIKTGELQNNELYDSEEKISELGVANSSAKLFKENTILIAMYGQGKTRGMTALLKVPCTTNQACAGIVMKSNSPYEIYYLWLTLQASYRALREKAVGTGQPNLSIGLLKDFYIPLPTLQEQKEVINFLKKVMPKYDSLITEKESLINDLEAYKKSLIYEVVTGKRKVV